MNICLEPHQLLPTIEEGYKLYFIRLRPAEVKRKVMIKAEEYYFLGTFISY